MWSKLRETAEAGLNQVSENATKIASQAGDVLREAQEDDEGFGGEEYGFVHGESAEREEQLRDAKKAIEQLEEGRAEIEYEKRAMDENVQIFQEELRKESELREALEAELNWHRGEKDSLQRKLVEMEADKADLADQLAQVYKGLDKNPLGGSTEPNSQEVQELEARALRAEEELTTINNKLSAVPATDGRTSLDDRLSALLEASSDMKEEPLALDPWLSQMGMALGVTRDRNSSTTDSMELILSALHSNLEGNSVSEVMELKQTLASLEKNMAELEGRLQTTEHEKRELRQEISVMSRTYEAENAQVRQEESLQLKQVQEQQARNDDLVREAEEQRKILESKLENSLNKLSSQAADYEALVRVQEALRRENETLKDSAGEVSTLRNELVRNVEKRAAIEEQCNELREKLENVSHPMEELRLRLQNLEQENETLKKHTPGMTSDNELSSLLQIKDSTICELTDEIQVLRDELRNQSANVKTGDADAGSQLSDKELEAQLASLSMKSNAAQAALENQTEELDEKRRRLRLVETALKNTRDECDELKRALVQAESARRKSEASSKGLNHMLQKEKESLERELSLERNAREESEQIVASLQESLQAQEKQLVSDQQALQKSIREDDEQKHKRIEELEMAAKTSAAKIENLERKVKRKDNELQLSQQTVVNLQGVLEDFQESQDSEIQSSLSMLKRELNLTVENKEQLQRELKELQQNLGADKKLLSEKDEMINSLNISLEMFKETNLAQKEEMARILCEEPPPGANANSVETSVVRELIVRYFESGTRAKREVLEIIAKTLLFSEEDMAKVGLARRGLLTSILGDDTSKDSVSEKWVEFLMRETEEDIATDANRVTAEEEQNSMH
ncbi:hypothetical protein NDN08_002623 [Rhodosorus marinus]|uniref:GRIP domain-containing protein n=1 Tax=Rhodosorus marinus TaxID=101924 RepID=A0AAV8UU85_9RHOD|nr:hypothetical protein NDN08_002623 [Rhodosorus marinus]